MDISLWTKDNPSQASSLSPGHPLYCRHISTGTLQTHSSRGQAASRQGHSCKRANVDCHLSPRQQNTKDSTTWLQQLLQGEPTLNPATPSHPRDR